MHVVILNFSCKIVHVLGEYLRDKMLGCQVVLLIMTE